MYHPGTQEASAQIMESPSKEPLARQHESSVAAFAQSLAYAGLESPALAIAQFGGNGAEASVQKFFGDIGIHAPDQQSSGFARTAGETLGSIADIYLLSRGVKKVVESPVPDAAAGFSRDGAIGLTMKQGMLTGALYGGLFSPSGPKGNLIEDRLLSGLTGAATFAAMTGTSIGLQKFAGTDSSTARFLAPLLRNPISNGAISGVPGALFNTYAETGINQHTTPSLGDVGKSVAEYSALGGIFGAGDMYSRPRSLGPEVAVTLGGGFGDDGETGPESILRAQAAAQLAKEHPNMKVILSGDGRPAELQDKPTEAQLMGDILKQNGISGKRLIYEDQSMDSIGNAVLTAARYLDGQKPGKVYVVTSPFHIERAVLSFKGVLGPDWQVEGVPSEVGYRDAVRGANESGGVQWTKNFYDGVKPGDLAGSIDRLNEVGKPVYRTLSWLQNLAGTPQQPA